MEQRNSYYLSPIGWILIEGTYEFIDSIKFVEEADISVNIEPTGAIANCLRQLEQYFNGTLKAFELPLRKKGTPFQMNVWDELLEIPYGETISYLQLAKRLGDEKVIRAAASANGKNPMAIVVPCHRVIGSDGRLTGYAGGLKRKQFLLDHEAKVCGKFNKLF
jgi:methylated-DNA-[protein]-cysteine S-methyltransferase